MFPGRLVRARLVTALPLVRAVVKVGPVLRSLLESLTVAPTGYE